MVPKKKASRTKTGPENANSTRRRSTRQKDDGPHPVDVHVGARVRQRRVELGMSQEKLGAAVQLTFQQIQKYERGTNRIGASRLFEFSTILDVPINYFYENLPMETIGAGLGLPGAEAGPETLRLVKTYYRISHADVRRRLYELVKIVAQKSR